MKWFSRKKLFPVKKWKLIDPEGRVRDIQYTERPSGPILNNVQYDAGNVWVKDEN